MTKPKSLQTEADVHYAEDEMAGWCEHCQDWVNWGNVESDAENYTCEVCEQETVQGVLNSLIYNLFEVA